MATVSVRDGQIKHLEEQRCAVCKRLLFRMDVSALKPGKVLELKCKCDAYFYAVGATT